MHQFQITSGIKSQKTMIALISLYMQKCIHKLEILINIWKNASNERESEVW